MTGPLIRDRSALYKVDSFQRANLSLPYELASLAIHHDCVTGEAELYDQMSYGSCVVLMGEYRQHEESFQQAEAMAKDLMPKLSSLHLYVHRTDPDWYDAPTRRVKYKISIASGHHFKFESGKEVVIFMNKVAAALGSYPVSPQCFKKEVVREVFVAGLAKRKRWTKETDWIALAALRVKHQENCRELEDAILALKEPGQSFRITLAPSLTQKAAMALVSMGRFEFSITPSDQAFLEKVGREGYVKKPLTIVVGFARGMNNSHYLSGLLAPHLEQIEMVSGTMK